LNKKQPVDILSIIKENRMNVLEIERQSGIPSSRVYKWLEGKGKPKVEDWEKLQKWANDNLEQAPRNLDPRNDRPTYKSDVIQAVAQVLVSLGKDDIHKVRADLLQAMLTFEKWVANRTHEENVEGYQGNNRVTHKGEALGSFVDKQRENKSIAKTPAESKKEQKQLFERQVLINLKANAYRRALKEQGVPPKKISVEIAEYKKRLWTLDYSELFPERKK